MCLFVCGFGCLLLMVSPHLGSNYMLLLAACCGGFSPKNAQLLITNRRRTNDRKKWSFCPKAPSNNIQIESTNLESHNFFSPQNSNIVCVRVRFLVSAIKNACSVAV